MALTDPDQYVQIMQDLLSLQIDMLKDKIDQEKQTLEKDDTTQSRPDLKYRLGQLPALVGRLNEASQQLAADPDSARDALQSVALDYLALENKDDLKKMPSQMVSLYNAASRTWNDLSVVIKAPVNVPPATKLTFDEKFEPVPAAVRVRQIEQIRGLVEWVVLGVSTGVALLIAFAALYTDTWGTSIDLVAALLWGTGVNVATAGAFTGIPQLRSELISIPTGFENDK